jgi:hypothetical protein
MKLLSKNQKEYIMNEIKMRSDFPSGFAINDVIDVELESRVYQVCSANAHPVKLLFLLIPNDSHYGVHETTVSRLCKKYGYDLGHYIKWDLIDNKIKVLFYSKELEKAK